ncbi:MAG: type II toxin-antitoxin system mRNA interferase toxin, RelE/StbE family [Bdellovibrio sp.]|nr:type II toxin-antitoxin system mRNA interferase toxin, RelE/StbE family [Bdellovibrio sp.]
MCSTKTFDKQLSKVLDFIRKKVLFWIFSFELNGIDEVIKSPGFHDEPLQGNRWGQRSIRLNKAYRLIYRVIDGRIHIELLEVHKHDY